QLLRLPVEEEIDVQIPEAGAIGPNDIEMLSLPDLRRRALAVSPVVMAAEVRVESAALGIGIAKTQYYPSLSLGGSLSTNFSTARRTSVPTGTTISNQTVYIDGNPVSVGFENPIFRFEQNPYGNQLNVNWGIGVGLQLSVPIYSQGSVQANIEQARINHQSAQLAKDQHVQVVTEELERNISD